MLYAQLVRQIKGAGSFWGNYLEIREDWVVFSLTVLEWSMPIHQNQSSLQNTVDFWINFLNQMVEVVFQKSFRAHRNIPFWYFLIYFFLSGNYLIIHRAPEVKIKAKHCNWLKDFFLMYCQFMPFSKTFIFSCSCGRGQQISRSPEVGK